MFNSPKTLSRCVTVCSSDIEGDDEFSFFFSSVLVESNAVPDYVRVGCRGTTGYDCTFGEFRRWVFIYKRIISIVEHTQCLNEDHSFSYHIRSDTFQRPNGVRDFD